jgi:hypothetical protein
LLDQRTPGVPNAPTIGVFVIEHRFAAIGATVGAAAMWVTRTWKKICLAYRPPLGTGGIAADSID